MIFSGNLLGILLALTAAGVWGSSDFSGGLATRRSSQYHVLAFSSLSGLILLALFALLWRESFPSWRGFMWAGLAGIAGSIGLASLYRALSLGNIATVAPTCAVIGAVIPVVFSSFTEGLPSLLKVIGFTAALMGIALVSQPASSEKGISRHGFLLACLAGVMFGGFFILIIQVDSGKIFTPLILARSVAFCAALLMLKIKRIPPIPLRSNPIAWFAGVFDASGNVLFLLAKQYTRLDIAAVLSSLYPAITVLLASLILKEKATRNQWIGAAICLFAIVLITL